MSLRKIILYGLIALSLINSPTVGAHDGNIESFDVEVTPADSLSIFARKRFMLGLRGGLLVFADQKKPAFAVPEGELEMSLRLYDKLWLWMGNFTGFGFECGLKYYIPFTDRTAFYSGIGYSAFAMCSRWHYPSTAVKAGLQHFLTDNVYVDFFTAGNFNSEMGFFRWGIGIGVSF